MAIVEIDVAQQKFDHSSGWEDNSNLWLSSILEEIYNWIFYSNLVKYGI
jgi:hypothetical protein